LSKEPKSKKEPMVGFLLNMPIEMKKQLEAVAEEEGRTPSNLVRYLIKEYINS